MKQLRKVFGFRMRPPARQREALARMAGARRYVWNWGLAQRIAHYRATGGGLSVAELSRRLTALKQRPETVWLREIDSQALQQALADLQRAYVNFFEKRARFPRFKSRKRDTPRFRIPQRVKVEEGWVHVPKVGPVSIRQSQPVDGEPKSATFKRDTTGNWDVMLVAEFTMPDTAPPAADPAHVVGIDLGYEDLAVLSDGGRIPAPRLFRKVERKLRKAQRVFSRREKGSARKWRAKRKVALVYRKTANQRKDFLHKLTTNLVVKYEGICIEDLNVAALAKRWYPSSKTCHVCGTVNDALTLADRSWTCVVCGAHHDRDLNAALNIRSEGLKILAAGYAERLNARGAGVSPPQLEAVGVEA